MQAPGVDNRRILSLVNRDKLTRLLQVMLSEEEFLAPYGIRSILQVPRKASFHL